MTIQQSDDWFRRYEAWPKKYFGELARIEKRKLALETSRGLATTSGAVASAPKPSFLAGHGAKPTAETMIRSMQSAEQLSRLFDM
jgi:hypothetical protein